MARSIAVIKNQILTEKAAQSSLSGLTSVSKTAIYNTWAYIIAVAINLLEQLIDLKVKSIETTVANRYSPSEKWLQAKIFEFQYDATTPQIVQIVNYVPTYNPVDTTKRIISRCSVKTNGQRIVDVKVARSEPPVALSAPQLSSLIGYLNQGGDGTQAGAGTGIGYVGVQFNVISDNPDKLYIKGTIKYNGQYNAVIQTNVIDAINTYLANIPFDGQVKVISLIGAIKSVPGVSDILIDDLAMRADATLFANKTYLIQSNTQIYTTYPTYAGYIVEETTSGETFADKLTFVAI